MLKIKEFIERIIWKERNRLKKEDRLTSIFTRMNENKTNPLVIKMKDLFLEEFLKEEKRKNFY